jgi:hypothetical protein
MFLLYCDANKPLKVYLMTQQLTQKIFISIKYLIYKSLGGAG